MEQQVKFNVFLPAIFIAQHFCFTISPVLSIQTSLESLEVDHRGQREPDRSPPSGSLDNECVRVDWSLLLKPRELFRAVKKYHGVGNLFAVSVILHSSILFYLLAKCCFHAVYTKQNKQYAIYIEANNYFPRIFESYPESHLLYNLTIALSLYCSFLKVINLYRLIRNSILNKDGYRQISVTQVDAGSLTMPNCSFSQWLALIRDGLRHGRECQVDFDTLASHLHLSKHRLEPTTTSSKLDLRCLSSRASKMRRLYDVNLIDFKKCYEKHEHLFKPEDRANYLSNWHCSEPIHRLDFYHWAIISLIFFSSVSLVFFFSIGIIISIYYMELSAAIQENEGRQAVIGLLEAFRFVPTYLSQPWRLIRLMDIFLVIYAEIPAIIDAQAYDWSAQIVASRAGKLGSILTEMRKFCLDYETIRYGLANPDLALPLAYLKIRCLSRYSLLFQEDKQTSMNQLLDEGHFKSLIRPKLNEAIKESMHLAGHLHAEFLDLKRVYSTYLTAMITYAALGTAFCISLLLEARSLPICFLLIAMGTCAAVPAIYNLIYSVLVERGVGINIYIYTYIYIWI